MRLGWRIKTTLMEIFGIYSHKYLENMMGSNRGDVLLAKRAEEENRKFFLNRVADA